MTDDDRLAVVGTRAGVLLALDPRTGDVRWRQGRGLRPCAVTAHAVVAVRVDDPDGPVVVVLDSADGRELWTAVLPDVPIWARRALADDPPSSLDCTLDGEQVLLRWEASTWYEGGAAPGARVLDEHARQADGAVRVDLGSRSVQPASPGDLAAHARPERETAELAGDRGLAADVVDAGRAGGLRVELATPAATDAVVLRGVDQEDDAVLWEVLLDQQTRRPPPLPQ
ncbi:outer membrane protein assembly factor BamB family protein [Modestobacter excelsi]|uniref:outer membrane protein assembly factor BamB family protein n=1 Tax=Modestobacter excelsi TaxID=2213161 RepID=UPI001C20DC65|nr:PQQ-binding-like beta-propeller repeat protein [Modestobacter excelsi]